MGAVCQVFVGLSLQGQLRNGSEFIKAEVLLFAKFLEEYGPLALDIPGYCLTSLSNMGKDGIERRSILLKIMGVWTPLLVEVREPNVFVLHDR